jgi:hypothetical protein
MEGVPQPANTNEAPKLSLEEMEAGIEEARGLYTELQEKYDDKDFYREEVVIKKREIDALSADLARILKDKVPNEYRAKHQLPNFPRYEGLPLAREEFPDEPPEWYAEMNGYKAGKSDNPVPVGAQQDKQ